MLVAVLDAAVTALAVVHMLRLDDQALIAVQVQIESFSLKRIKLFLLKLLYY